MDSKQQYSILTKKFSNVPKRVLVYALIALFLLITYGIIGSHFIMRLDLIN